MNPRKLLLLVPVVSALFFAVACGDDSDDRVTVGTDGGADATADTSPVVDGSSDAGTEILPSDATQIVATDKGGFGASVGDASTCQPQDATYTLLLPSQALSWKVCEPSKEDAGADRGPTYTFVEGQRTLTSEESTALRNLIIAMRPSTSDACGADKPDYRVAVTSPRGTVTYQDDFYACNKNDDVVYVTGMDAVLGEFRKLATAAQ